MSPPTKSFALHSDSPVDQGHLAEVQLASYEWFRNQGLRELFSEVSPINDYAGKDIELHLTDYYFDEPKFDEAHAKLKDLTYEAPLRVKTRLVNHRTNETKEQEVYFGDFPLMTKRGTFIINGVERVVISQLIRSAGVYFSATVYRGRTLFGAKVIPNRGVWLEFETDPDGSIGVKIDRRRKVAVTSLLRIFSAGSGSLPTLPTGRQVGQAGVSGGGPTDDELRALFADVDTGEVRYLDATLKKDTAKNVDDSYVEIYKRVRPGDLASLENMRGLIEGMFMRSDRYDLSPVGRYKFNQRLSAGTHTHGERLLTRDDLVGIVREIIRLNNDSTSEGDDIDHLGNRRVRPVGELFQSRLRIGLARMRRIVQDRMSTLDVATITAVQLINARPLISVVRDFFVSSQLSQFMDQLNPL
ncbi:MAG: DNA-directed RNA polymerase subunit beta, partial [Candidatus Colwellbacteria bacterium]|nr:DNA-directed RNA polymerase subunit beta [Candidatus Colwellbacteria bacterium]